MLQMEGNIEFYKHAGFCLASKLRIHYHDMPQEEEVPFFLAQELIPGYWSNREGTYCPPKGYFVADEDPEAFEAYEKGFPKKAKAYNDGQLPPFAEKAKLMLRTGRLTLRPWFESDADSLFNTPPTPTWDLGRAGHRTTAGRKAWRSSARYSTTIPTGPSNSTRREKPSGPSATVLRASAISPPARESPSAAIGWPNRIGTKASARKRCKRC